MDFHSSYAISAGLVVIGDLFAIEFSLCAIERERSLDLAF